MITDVYAPRVGGVSTAVRTLAREYQAKGHEVTLIAPAYDQAPDDPREDVIRISSRTVLFSPEDRMMKPSRVLELTERLRGWRYDIVHIQTPFVAHYVGVMLARRLGVPCIETYHTVFEEYLRHYVSFLPTAWAHSLAKWFSTSQCNAVDTVIVPSSAMFDELRDYGVYSPIEIIPPGVEPHLFKIGDGERFRQAHNIAPDRPTLVYVGRLGHEKNIEFLLEVVQELRQQVPQILLVLAGAGPSERQLKRRAAELGLTNQVLFVGNLPRTTELLDCYRAGDIFVFASRTEMQGLVLLEAMAAGVPVVGTALMGTKDILKAQRGALIAEDNVGDFAAKVLKLLREPDLRAKLAEEGMEYANQWSASASAERMLDCYSEVIRSRAPLAASRRSVT